MLVGSAGRLESEPEPFSTTETDKYS